MDSLRSKLKSLGVQIGAQGIQPKGETREAFPIEDVVRGAVKKTIFGETYVVDELFPPEHQFGVVQLTGNVEKDIFSMWSRSPTFDQVKFDEIAFLDTETSGLSGGAGTIVFMVGIGWFSSEGFIVSQLFLRSPGEERAFLAELTEIMDPFKAIVTYNGKSFDIPMLSSRHFIHKISFPLANIIHLDLLHLARKLWKYRLTERRLGNIEEHILGIVRDQREVPGWMVPEIYFDYLKTGDARAVEGVFYHNKIDILSLAALYQHMGELLKAPMMSSDIVNLELIAIAQLFEELGRFDDASALYLKSLEIGLPEQYQMDTLTRYARMQKRRLDWGAAIELWAKAAEIGSVDACIELAKYYEHKENNIVGAICWTKRGNENLSNIDSVERKLIYAQELEHRANRLKRKNA